MNPRLGDKVSWKPAKRPERVQLRGSHILVRPLDAEVDCESLFDASHRPDGDPSIWTYLPYGPYKDQSQMLHHLKRNQASIDPLFFTFVCLSDERPRGIASYLRIKPEFGVIEIGHIWFGTQLQKTTTATEAIYLLMRYVFDGLGYRRLEWKCDALNTASRRAAERFGFTFEGTFRKHMVVKGRNRDTAWYAVTDDEWPAVRSGFEKWLEPENFDGSGRQRLSLGTLIDEVRN